MLGLGASAFLFWLRVCVGALSASLFEREAERAERTIIVHGAC